MQTSGVVWVATIAALLVSVHQQTRAESTNVTQRAAPSWLMPRVRCIAAFYRPSALSSTDPPVTLLVEEYTDLTLGRSTVRVTDKRDERAAEIYYNRVGSSSEAFRRRLTVFEEQTSRCKSATVFNWPLTSVGVGAARLLRHARQPAFQQDVAIGPSILRAAVGANTDRFRYVTTKTIPDRLARVDVFEWVTKGVIAGELGAVVTLHTFSEPDLKPEAKKDRSSVTLADFVRQRDGTLPELALVRYCQRNVDSQFVLERGSATTEYKCPKFVEQLFTVEFFAFTELSGSLATQVNLDEGTPNSIVPNLHLNPFLEPVGVDCQSADLALAVTRRFEPHSSQFSATYTTSNGSHGATFVAFDRDSEMLRFDGQDRRGVWDLNQRRSYHVAGADAMRWLGGAPSERRSCIVLDMTDDTWQASTMMERLLGVGSSAAEPAYHVGSVWIQMNAYEVYESPLALDEKFGAAVKLPVLLEPDGWSMSAGGRRLDERRFFVTYYVSELPRGPNKRPLQVPKFAELWQWNYRTRERLLLNRIEFVDFSWRLDVVAPDGDQETGGASRRIKLFNLDACALERSGQLRLRFRLLQNAAKAESRLWRALELGGGAELVEGIQRKLASVLGLSCLNVAHLEYGFLPVGAADPAKLLVEARLIELRAGITQHQRLGFVALREFARANSIPVDHVFTNRHSLEMAMLDSLTLAQRNVLMYCAGITRSLLLAPETLDNPSVKALIVESAAGLEGSDGDQVVCSLHLVSWAPEPELARATDQLVLNRVRSEYYRLTGVQFEINFDTGATLSAFLYEPELQALEASRSELARAAPLSGLRFASPLEDPMAVNKNQAIRLARARARKRHLFSYCQAACQMDPYCQSFSYCERRPTSASDSDRDCILSSLALTSENLHRLEDLAAGLRDSSAPASDSSLRLVTSDQHVSQVFAFRQDADCTMHPRDALASFRFQAQRALARTQPQSSSGGPAEDVGGADEPGAEASSLEECASEALQRGARPDQGLNASFAYCPLEALCLQEPEVAARTSRVPKPEPESGRNAQNSSNTTTTTCYAYTLAHDQFYERYRLMRMAISLAPEARPQEEPPVAPARNQWTPLSGAQELAKHRLARVIEGISEQACAHDCNLHQSHCLAFDWCWPTPVTSLCIMYTIRSPVVAPTRAENSPDLLERELSFYGPVTAQTNDSAMLIATHTCDHYTLKGAHLEVRLDQRLSNSDERLSALDEEEEQLLEGQVRASAERLRQAIQASLERLAKGVSKAGRSEHAPRLLLFMVGALLGSLLVVYGGSLMVLGEDLRNRLSAQRARHTMPRLSELALERSFDQPPAVRD